MDLTIEDLFIKCAKCDGVGRYKGTSPNTPGSIGMSYITEGICPNCGGKGGKLTEKGEVLADFMEILRKQHRI